MVEPILLLGPADAAMLVLKENINKRINSFFIE